LKPEQQAFFAQHGTGFSKSEGKKKFGECLPSHHLAQSLIANYFEDETDFFAFKFSWFI